GIQCNLRCARSTNGLDRDWTPAEAAEPPMLARVGGSLSAKGPSVSAMKSPRGQPHLSLLVTTPLHHHDRPAAGLHAAVETPLTDPLRAALGACLRARGPLLGRCPAVRHGEQRHAEHGAEAGSKNKAAHDVGLGEGRNV